MTREELVDYLTRTRDELRINCSKTLPHAYTGDFYTRQDVSCEDAEAAIQQLGMKFMGGVGGVLRYVMPEVKL